MSSLKQQGLKKKENYYASTHATTHIGNHQLIFEGSKVKPKILFLYVDSIHSSKIPLPPALSFPLPYHL